MKKIVTMFICMLVLCMSYSNVSRADFGPKPSVQIDFVNLGDELCYGTLLSKTKSTGPSSAYEVSGARHNEKEGCEYLAFDYETWKKFVDYEDSDGFYFLQEGWIVNETKELNWTYYPPQTFKILLYFPTSDSFVVSEIYERYAFDSHFTVDMADMNASTTGTSDIMIAEESYDYTWEIISLAARIVATILIEVAIAYVFLYKNAKQVKFIIIVNMVTQVVLNVALNIVNYRSGYLMFCFAFAGYEIIVFLIESLIYQKTLPRWESRERWGYMPAAYALVANVASCLIGFGLAKWIPGIG